tara:strand:+ start:824 stop:1033 length:210 start_codon:yes stop_codon:yes gene_type:complete
MITKFKDDLLTDEESPSVFEILWDYAMTFFKCVGIFAIICFALGYISTKQAQAKQCELNKVVLTRSIFK